MESAWSVAGQAKTEIRKPVAQSAFTMIEIALALGVIGFALVAIIGILPAGLNVQRLAREDTLIAQDGPFLMQAIRNGAPAVLTNGEYQVIGGPSVSVGGATSLDFLTNYVDQITTTFITGNSTTVVNYAGAFTNGAAILGLLSRPDFPGTNVVTTAKMRGFSGGATEQNGSNAVIAFRYYMDVEVTPFSTYSEAALDQDNNGQFTTNEALSLNQNLYNVRLKFRWPVRPNGTVGPGRQTYQSLVSANMAYYSNSMNGETYWFLQPANYVFSTNAL